MEPIKEIKFERVYDAPIDRVWQAWTDPKMMEQWWGPNDVIIPECEVDLRVAEKFTLLWKQAKAWVRIREPDGQCAANSLLLNLKHILRTA